MSNCGCENKRDIFPDCDMNRWETQCSSYIVDADNYYTKKEVDDLIEGASGCCITPEEVDEKIESAKTEIEAEIPSLSGYATEQWVLDKNYISGVDLSNYALKSEIPTVPTSNTAFTNDAGYITSDALSGYQMTLSAGTGIDITNNVISATGGSGTTYTAGRAIDITNNTVSLDLPISASTGIGSIAEGFNTVAQGNYSHAEGSNTFAKGYFSHAEGFGTSATSSASHAEGYYTLAYDGCHAEGLNTQANGYYSHAEGINTITYNQSEHASGQYNNSVSASTTFGDSGNTLFSVGNGTSTAETHNAFEIRQNGDIYLSSGGTDIKLQDHLGGGIEYSAGTNVQISNNVISATDTTYTAGDNISISNQNVISTVTKFWCGSYAEWGLISGGTLDSNTIYMIY